MRSMLFSTVSFLEFLFITHGTFLNENVTNSENALFEGDIRNIPRTVEDTRRNSSSRLSAAVTHSSERWNVHIPFEFSETYSLLEKRFVHLAMQEFHFFTCIRFVERSEENNYVKFVHGNFCDADVGLIGGGQTISLKKMLNGVGCFDRNTVLHELMHVLGFYHEHSRYDRDKYVKIHLENIEGNAETNFKRQHFSNFTHLGTDYDYSSVMHYPSTAYAKDLKSITIEPIRQGAVIKANGLSQIDIIKINRLYNCPSNNSVKIFKERWTENPSVLAKKIDDLAVVTNTSISYLYSSHLRFEKASNLFREHLETTYGGIWNVIYYQQRLKFEAAGSFVVGHYHTISGGAFTKCFFAEVLPSTNKPKLNCNYWKRVLDKNNMYKNGNLREIVKETFYDMKPFDYSPKGSIYCGEMFKVSTRLTNFCEMHINVPWRSNPVRCVIYQH